MLKLPYYNRYIEICNYITSNYKSNMEISNKNQFNETNKMFTLVVTTNMEFIGVIEHNSLS